MWIVCHADVGGGGAWEANAHASAYVFAEPDIPHKRFLALRKRRFRPAFTELEAEVEAHERRVKTPWGTEQNRVYEYAALGLSTAARRVQEREVRKELDRTARENELRSAILAFVEEAGKLVSKNAIEKGVGGKAAKVREVVDQLVAEGVLAEGGVYNGHALYAVAPLANRDEMGRDAAVWAGEERR